MHDLDTIQALNAEAVRRGVGDRRERLVAEFDERVAALRSELAVRLAELDEIVGELG